MMPRRKRRLRRKQRQEASSLCHFNPLFCSKLTCMRIVSCQIQNLRMLQYEVLEYQVLHTSRRRWLRIGITTILMRTKEVQLKSNVVYGDLSTELEVIHIEFAPFRGHSCQV